MPVAKPLHLRLFLEGIEIPVVSAQIGINVNAPATASIQIVPLDEAMEMHPRTMVHLFFLSDDIQNADGKSKLEDTYKLLFTGEVIGFSFIKSATGRGLVLQCLDFSSYWDAAHATAMGYGPGGNALTQKGAAWGSDVSIIDDLVSHEAELLVSWIRQRPQTPGLETVSGLAGGIIRVMEALGGVTNRHKGINDFFTIAELRCRLLEQIAAEEHDSTAASLLELSVFMEWVKSGLQNSGQQITFRDMMKILCQYIYYDCVPNPTPKFDQVQEGKTTVGSSISKQLAEHPLVESAISSIALITGRLGTALGFTDLEAIRFFASEEGKSVKSVQASLKQLSVSDNKSSSSLQQALSTLDAAIASLAAAQNVTTIDTSSLKNAKEQLSRASGKLLTGEDKVFQKTRDITGVVAQRLKTQIFRPDCWFVAAPKCNVIFPEQYTQLSYDRTFLAEVTRTLLGQYAALIGNVGYAQLLADDYFAPNVSSTGKYVVKNTGESGWRTLMPHEYHTGIIVRREWIPDTQLSVSGLTSDQTGKFKHSQIDWGLRAAYFHFYKYRYAPRAASVSGRFNPLVVCGFPAVIITRPFIVPGLSAVKEVSKDVLAFIKGASVDTGAPQQLLGMVGGIQHNVDQQGGSTSISLNHVRTHLGADDAFVKGFAEEESSTVSRPVRVVLTFDAVQDNPQLKKLLQDATPQELDASNVRTTTSEDILSNTAFTNNGTVVVSTVAETEQTSKFVLPPNTDVSRIRDINRDVLIPAPSGVLKIGDQGRFGKIYGIEVLDADIQISDNLDLSFAAVALYEDVEVEVQSSRPIEYFIFPKWMSGKYENDKIGPDIYNPFFGVDSIIDELNLFGNLRFDVNAVQTVPDMSPAQDLVAVKTSLANVEKNAALKSIQSSVNLIGYLYGLIKSQDLGAEEFIRSFTDRPIATKADVLGSDDLVIDKEAIKDGDVQAITGTVGFHTTAVHPDILAAGPLAGLLKDPTSKLSRINDNGDPTPVPPQYDVRQDKLDMVARYVRALAAGRAFKG